jgi:hypothetical protein
VLFEIAKPPPTGIVYVITVACSVCCIIIVFVGFVSINVSLFLFIQDSEEADPEPEQEELDPNAGRFVRYQFTPQFLKLKTVGAT